MVRGVEVAAVAWVALNGMLLLELLALTVLERRGVLHRRKKAASELPDPHRERA